LDATGKPQFCEPLRRRNEPVFYAFDCLCLDREDPRGRPIIERKRILEDLMGDQPRILYANHVKTEGVNFLKLVCEQDLEGMVCKHRLAPYGSESAPWIKVLKPGLFSARRPAGVLRS
jgi:bifunctional non-homologous end joining protein LigD